MADVFSRLKLIQSELDLEQAKNTRLEEENALLRRKLRSQPQLLTDSAASIANVEARIKALKMEDERDRMFENLEKIKKKYNTLHGAYLEKVKRCSALEDVFKRQKTLTGLVMKSALDQRQQEQMLQERERENSTEPCPIKDLETKVMKMESELNEAYDIIDELEFELESIDYLEMENERMRNELREMKQQVSAKPTGTTDQVDIASEGAQAGGDSCRSSISSIDHGDIDSTTLERMVLNDALIRNAETEGGHLRRELLRSRLNHTRKLKATDC